VNVKHVLRSLAIVEVIGEGSEGKLPSDATFCVDERVPYESACMTSIILPGRFHDVSSKGV
jgi:hypothetical protein